MKNLKDKFIIKVEGKILDDEGHVGIHVQIKGECSVQMTTACITALLRNFERSCPAEYACALDTIISEKGANLE